MNKEIPVIIGDIKTVTIESLGKKGAGIAKIDTFAIIVPDTKLNETLKVKITNVKDTYAFAMRL